MTPAQIDSRLLLILRISTFCCFAGWTWVHFYWEGPYGALLWQDATYGLAERMGISWETFVGTGANDGVVQRVIGWIGWLYLLCAIATLFLKSQNRALMAIVAGGSGLLMVLAYAKYVGAQRQLPMFVEYGGQYLGPIVLVLAVAMGARHRATIGLAIAACVMTFAGHGAFAFGWHWPTPANFHAMTTVILGLEPETTRIFLKAAGLLDFLVCIGLFIPQLRRASALYMVAWGLLTALARPVAGMSLDLNYWGADQFLHEAVLRAPHFLLPLFLFAFWTFIQRDPTLPTRANDTGSDTP